jgi:pyrophosphatase PpaX
MTEPDDAPGWDAVLFDLDGTLADTVALILESYRHTMRVHLGEAPPDQRWLDMLGRPLHDQLQVFARTEAEAEAMLDTYVTYQRSVHDEMTRPYPSAHEVLTSLSERGTALGVVTSKRSGIAQRTLEVCELWDHFQVVVCADHVANGKPHPEPVERALHLLGIHRRRRVLFVGDSPFDMEAGRRGGVRTAAALWGPFDEESLLPTQPDFVVRELTAVLQITP